MHLERRRLLRGPVFRRVGEEIVSLLLVDGVEELPQIAGEALLIALDLGTPNADAVGSRLRRLGNGSRVGRR